MIIHILAILATITLTEWLIIAAWMSRDWQYYFWSGLVVLAWWYVTKNNNPPWPHPRFYILRVLIFIFFFGLTSWFALMTREWPAYLIALSIPILLGVENIRPRASREV